jgi:FSR family fosmidomycin resistance protein-like MFS transporter
MYQPQRQAVQKQPFKMEYVIYLVLFVVAVRSLVGFAVVFPWKSDINLLVILTTAVAMGKGLGGWLADKFGWGTVAAGSLLLSIPLLTMGPSIAALGIFGMFLFNITMPVTLTIMSNVLPGRPGTAFGLTCATLVLGTLPAFSTLQPSLNNPVLIDILIVVSALALLLGLRYYHQVQAVKSSRSVIAPGTALNLQEEE